MMRISKYILFQLFGWGLFALLNIYIAYITRELTQKIFIGNLVLSIIGFGVSHYYKKYIQHHNWLHLETEKLIRNVLIVTCMLSIVYNIFYYTYLYFSNSNSFANITSRVLLVSFISVYILFAVWNLIYFSWIYIEKNKRIQIETLKMESSLKDLEIKTLRSNLQPHFIFNSLNSIRALIDENPELARDAVTKISNILRNTITKQETTDTLQNELNFIDDYLTLEKIRFEERLHVEKNIAPECLQYKVPTMMLQTLVENAIKHGISKKEEGGKIILNIALEANYLHIEIINDIGESVSHNSENSLGFGISSTKNRLKLLYGNDAHFSLDFKKKSAIVDIKIPIQKIT